MRANLGAAPDDLGGAGELQQIAAGKIDDGRGGLAKDEREATRLLRLAADQGLAEAQSNLARFYSQGVGGLPQDDDQAIRLLKLAAQQGFEPEQRFLAQLGTQ